MMQRIYLPIMALAIRVASYEVACPSCTTTTITVPAPCPFPLCTGSTSTETLCTSTVYTIAATITREPTTLNPVNPGCPYTPTATFVPRCPTAEPCSVQSCITTDTITIGWTSTTGDFVTVTPPPLECSPTGPGIPSPDPTTETTINTEITPPPIPTIDPDPCETGDC